MTSSAKKTFLLELIAPSHYDDDGYVIQWYRAIIPSNSLACMYALAEDVKDRHVLGADVEIRVRAYDECHTVVPTGQIIREIAANGGQGLVLLIGVQTNQFPRAADLARQFRAGGVPVAIGGFHVSGCLAMLKDLPPELRELEELGVTLFAGEAEGRLEGLLHDAAQGALQPIYNYLGDLPDLRGQVPPMLPREVARRTMMCAPFDCGRGCPFQCSFCTIINVQGHKSRWREADDVERVVCSNLARGIRRFFITDDNLARNKNWEAIFDRLIAIRAREGVRLKLAMQVDVMAYKIPGFIEKATAAGCNRVFMGLENINAENLAAANKSQNSVPQYRTMLQAWRNHGAVTYAGYIIGLPGDTPESIERDIRTIQRELPVDILQFMLLTPLPGSADHRALVERGARLDPDLNRYDVEHVTCEHSRMTGPQWQDIYHRAWHLYYSWDHVTTLLRRAKASPVGARHVAYAIMTYYAAYRFEKLHPLQCGLFRRKSRATRRPGLPKPNPLVFHLGRAWEIASTYGPFAAYCLKIERLRRRIEHDPQSALYTDAALTPDEHVDMPLRRVG